MTPNPRVIICTALLAMPWLWPFVHGPFRESIPFFIGLFMISVAFFIIPKNQNQIIKTALYSLMLAALLNATIALLQYTNNERMFYPFFNLSLQNVAFGNLRQPNQLATLLVIGLFTLRWLYLEIKEKTKIINTVFTISTVIIIAALAATASRIGFVEIVFFSIISIIWSKPNERRNTFIIVFTLFVLYILAAIFLPYLLHILDIPNERSLFSRISNSEYTCGSRKLLYSNVLEIIFQNKQNMLFGIGANELSYAHYITPYKGERFCYILNNAHNLPLHIAVTMGIPTAILFTVACIFWVLYTKFWSEKDNYRQVAFAIILTISLHSLVEYPLWYITFELAFIFSLYILYKEYIKDTKNIFNSIAIVTASIVIIFAYDYFLVMQVFTPDSKRVAWLKKDADYYSKKSIILKKPYEFAKVVTTKLDRQNAKWLLPISLRALKYSNEPRIIIKVIETSTLLGEKKIAMEHLERFKRIYPNYYAKWNENNY